MKYPLKETWPLDADGKLPSDKAYEDFQRFMARCELRILAKRKEEKSA